MGVASRLTAPVSQLKCYSRGNFSADTLLLLFRLFAESSLFRSMWPGHHSHVETLANKMAIYKKCSCLWCQLQTPSPMTKASFQAALNPKTSLLQVNFLQTLYLNCDCWLRLFWGHWPDPCKDTGGWIGSGTADELHILLSHMPAFVNSLDQHHWCNCNG